MAGHGALGKVWHHRNGVSWLYQTVNNTKNQSKTDCFLYSSHQSITVISETNCPTALVPAPPAVKVIPPSVAIVPARDPADPEA